MPISTNSFCPRRSPPPCSTGTYGSERIASWSTSSRVVGEHERGLVAPRVALATTELLRQPTARSLPRQVDVADERRRALDSSSSIARWSVCTCSGSKWLLTIAHVAEALVDQRGRYVHQQRVQRVLLDVDRPGNARVYRVTP